MELPERNYDNIHKALKQIKDNPETWDQTSWHCGSSHCFAGWGQVQAGCAINDDSASRDAQEHFGFTSSEAKYFFSSLRTLPELAQALLPLDDDGYNRDGYDRAGYNRAGYDRAGYNRAGYDRAGYNRDGYNRDGYNRAGYNSDGYNSDGYNRAGYNSDGYNRAGEDSILSLIDNYPNA